MNDYLTLAQVAAKTGIAATTLRTRCRAGEIPAIRAARDWLIDSRHVGKIAKRKRGNPTFAAKSEKKPARKPRKSKAKA